MGVGEEGYMETELSPNLSSDLHGLQWFCTKLPLCESVHMEEEQRNGGRRNEDLNKKQQRVKTGR